MAENTMGKALFLERFYLYRERFFENKVAGSVTGFANPCFGYLLSGSGTFVAQDRTIPLSMGDLVFIPNGQIYTSYWTADPECSFYSLNFELASPAASRQLFTFSALHAPELLPLMDRMYRESRDGDKTGFSALGAFYDLLAYAQSRMEMARRPGDSAIRAAIDEIEKNSDKDIPVPMLAKLCCLSESRFYEVFRASTGYTPTQYKNLMRVRRVETLLMQGDHSVEEICELTGFASPSYLRRVYRRFTGTTPKETRSRRRSI